MSPRGGFFFFFFFFWGGGGHLTSNRLVSLELYCIIGEFTAMHPPMVICCSHTCVCGLWQSLYSVYHHLGEIMIFVQLFTLCHVRAIFLLKLSNPRLAKCWGSFSKENSLMTNKMTNIEIGYMLKMVFVIRVSCIPYFLGSCAQVNAFRTLRAVWWLESYIWYRTRMVSDMYKSMP